MLKSAVGFNAARGDVLTLSVFPFAASDLSVAPPVWWQQETFLELVKLGVIALVSLLLLLLVVRPALSRLMGRTQAQNVLAPDPLKVGNESDHRALPPSLAAQNRSGMLGELNPLSEIQLPAAGSGLELQVEHLQMLAENDPERVSEVIKQWIGRNESSFPSAN